MCLITKLQIPFLCTFGIAQPLTSFVNKLRAHYVWNEKDDLPEWIAEPLKDFPLLASYAQTLLQTLRSIPTSFGDQEATEYDLLVNCMITDQIMTSLREFELHYRAAHPYTR